MLSYTFCLEDMYSAPKDILADNDGAKLVKDENPPFQIKGLMSMASADRNSHQEKFHDYKLNSRCAVCGQVGHWARDPEFLLKKS